FVPNSPLSRGRLSPAVAVHCSSAPRTRAASVTVRGARREELFMSALASFVRSQFVRTSRRAASFKPQLTALEAREVPAVTAVFNTSVLAVVGDANANSITVAADASGNLTVTDGATPVFIRVTFGTPTKTNLTFVSVDAKGGNDTITLDRSLN